MLNRGFDSHDWGIDESVARFSLVCLHKCREQIPLPALPRVHLPVPDLQGPYVDRVDQSAVAGPPLHLVIINHLDIKRPAQRIGLQTAESPDLLAQS